MRTNVKWRRQAQLKKTDTPDIGFFYTRSLDSLSHFKAVYDLLAIFRYCENFGLGF